MLWMVLNVVGHGDVVGDAVDGDDGIKYLALAGEWCSLLASRVVVAVAFDLHHHAYPDPRTIQTEQTRLQDTGLCLKTSQELRMLFYCQVTMVVMFLCSQFSEMSTISQLL